MIACENIRFSSLSAAGDVSLGGTSATLEPHDYRIYYVNIDLRHRYGNSVAGSQTFLRVKRPQRQGARMFSQARNVTTRAFRTKRMSKMSSFFFFLALVVPPNFIYCGKRLVGLIGYLNHLTFSSELTIISLVKCQPFSSTKTAPFKFHTNKIIAVLSLILYR